MNTNRGRKPRNEKKTVHNQQSPGVDDHKTKKKRRENADAGGGETERRMCPCQTALNP